MRLHADVKVTVEVTVSRSLEKADIDAAQAANLLERPEDAEKLLAAAAPAGRRRRSPDCGRSARCLIGLKGLRISTGAKATSRRFAFRRKVFMGCGLCGPSPI